MADGSIKRLKLKGGKVRYRLRLDLGCDADGNRKQKCYTVKGTEKEAQQKLRELLSAVDGNVFVEPRKLTLGQWLKEWIDTQAAAGSLRASTVRRYRDVIEDACASDVA